ncbi:hypothetical protein GCM10009559_35090 [Pseudonocardia zijingensis]|uniref:Uncharacterized protein n=1 Tax=Pseudonocardia zijingensis TaxID=153376 RepID=A0ABN1QBB1_9PSEU
MQPGEQFGGVEAGNGGSRGGGIGHNRSPYPRAVDAEPASIDRSRPVIAFYSRRLGCLGSVLLSVLLTACLILLFVLL